MSVIIKGINKPKMCKEGEKHCFAWNDEQYRCNITKWEKSCPLVEIPTPHGRLIDRDAVPEVSADPYEEGAFQGTLDDMPVFLEAEE